MVPTTLATDSHSTEVVPAEAHSARRGFGSLRVRTLIATLLIGLVAPLFVSTTSADAAIRPRSAGEAQIQKAVLKLMNQQRHKHHLGSLKMNHKLQIAARRHNFTMARYNRMSHQLPREAFFSKRISKAGYNWSWAGENIAWNSAMNTNGVLVLQKMMYNERAPYDGHRKNILSRNFREVGIDVYVDRKHHKIWLTTDFARRR